MPAGRPPTYNSPEELQAEIDEYFKNPPRTKTYVTKSGEEITVPLLTITGLALYLGFCSRQSFYDYEDRKEFSYTVKRARSFIEVEYEEMLRHGNCTGAIFALKQFDWSDKHELEHSGGLQINMLGEAIAKSKKC